MTPPINPAFAKYVVSVLPSLPDALQSKTYLANLEKGLTTTGGKRKRTSQYWPRVWRRKG